MGHPQGTRKPKSRVDLNGLGSVGKGVFVLQGSEFTFRFFSGKGCKSLKKPFEQVPGQVLTLVKGLGDAGAGHLARLSLEFSRVLSLPWWLQPRLGLSGL